jgi:AcrR family transcriptional regulator
MARTKRQDQDPVNQQNRQRLLEAAAAEFARAGFRGANINTISTGAGFAKGTIYNYFPSKQALLVALIENTAQRHLAYIAGPVRAETDPVRRLEVFYQAGFEFVVGSLPHARVMFNTINDPDEPLRARVYQCYQPLFELMAREILAPGMAQGAFRDVDPVAMSNLLMTVYLGTASQVNEEGRPFLDPRQVAGLILRGLSKAKETEHGGD